MRQPRPRGLTLLEIVLSLGIFCGALAALSQLAWSGTRATVQARLKTQAVIRCEAKLNEVLAGIGAMVARSNTPFPDDSHWTWSQIVVPSSHPELVQIDLTVSHRGGSRLSNIDVTLRRSASRAIAVRERRQSNQGRRGTEGQPTMKNVPRRGFTLLETMLALSLSIILLGRFMRRSISHGTSHPAAARKWNGPNWLAP